jgi:rSAM/selenodomain-associated transferase 1
MTSNSSLPTLGVFAKWPVPGQVKTRLAAATSADWAAKVAMAFLLDTLDRLAIIEARRILAYAPAKAGDQFAAIAGGRFVLLPQGDGDLGQRMAAFFSTALPASDGRVVLVGADSPTLPTEYILTALAELRSADLVLGPATDGGYYLIGCAGQVPPVFDGIAWGGSRVLADTALRLRAAGLRLALLPPWYDVDTLDDWHLLRGHLAALRAAGRDPGAPHTEVLSSLPVPSRIREEPETC